MQSSSQRIVKNTILLYMRQLFTLALGLYTTRLTLQLLGVTDFGIYAAAGGVTSVLIVLSSVFTIGSQRFLTVELAKQDFKQLNCVYIACTNLQIVCSGILILIGETIGLWFLLTQMTIPADRFHITFWVYQISLFANVLTMLNVPNEAVVAARENFGIIALISVVVSIMKLLFVIALFFISWDKLILYAIAVFIIQFFNRVIISQYTKKHYPETHYYFQWDKTLMKSMLKVSFWYGIYGLSTTGVLHGVTILLNLFFGPAINAAYAVAAQIYMGFRMFCNHFQSASYPQIVKLYTTGESNRLAKLLASVCKISFFLIFTITLPFLFNAEHIMRIWLGEVPIHTTTFFVMLMIYSYTDVLMLPLDRACLASGKVRTYNILVSVLLILILPFSYIAFYMGAIPETIYIIAIIMSWFGLFLRVRLLKGIISLNQMVFYKQVIVKSLIVTMLSLIVPSICYYFIGTGITSLVFIFILTYFITAAVVYYVGLDEQEKILVRQVLLSGKERLLRK